MAAYLLLESGDKIILEDGTGDLLVDAVATQVALTDSLPLSETLAAAAQYHTTLTDVIDLDDSTPLTSGSTFSAALTDTIPLSETLQRAVSDCDRVRTSSAFGEPRLDPVSWTWDETLITTGRMAPATEYCGTNSTSSTQSNTDALALAEALTVTLNHPTFTAQSENNEAWFTGFEENSLTLAGLVISGSSATPTLVTDPVHSGGGVYACQLDAGDTITAQIGTPVIPPNNGVTNPLYSRFYFRIETMPSSNFTLWSAPDATAPHNELDLILTAAGHLEYFRDPDIGGGLSHTLSTTLALDAFYRVEITWTDTTHLTVELFSGDDTSALESYTDTGTNNNNAAIDNFRLGETHTTPGGRIYIDDWSIGRDSSTLGPATTVLLPLVAAVSTQWTPTGFGTNLACVDDAPGTPDDDTGYVVHPGGTAIDRYTIDTTSVPSAATINRILVGLRAKATVGTPWGQGSAWKSDGTRIDGPAYFPQLNNYSDNASALTSRFLILLTSGLTGAQLASVNVGLRSAWSNANEIRVTTLFACTEFTLT